MDRIFGVKSPAEKERIRELALVIDATLGELADPDFPTINDPQVALYAQVLIAYFRSDVATLSKLLAQAQSEFPNTALTAIIELRLALRSGLLNSQQLEFLEKQIQENSPESIWLGEAAFACANFRSEQDESDPKSPELYRYAHEQLERLGAKKKSVRALLNHYVGLSHQKPEQNFLVEYRLVARRARLAESLENEGLAYLNLARCYLALGSKLAALRDVNKAIQLLELEFGSVHYELAVAQRARTLIEIGHTNAAAVDIDSIRNSKFPSVQGAVRSLIRDLRHCDQFRLSTDPIDEKTEDLIQASPTSRWNNPQRTRLNETAAGAGGQRRAKIPGGTLGLARQVSPMESQLIELLTEGPKTKEALIQTLYGEDIDFLAAENRLRVLVCRIRKKVPELVHYDRNEYKLADSLNLLGRTN